MSSILNRTEKIFKIIAILGFVLLLFTITILLNAGPASSYEYSIYDAYPWYFWIFLLSAITCGQVVIIGSAITGSRKDHWIFGLGIILLAVILLLFLPVIRGYFIFGDGDVLTHIGYMKDILQTSVIGENHYPIDHILGVIVNLWSGLTLEDITFFIPPVFSLFFIFSMYCVGKIISENTFERLIILVLSSILMLGEFHLAFTPNSQALLFIPLVLFLAFRIYEGVNNSKYQFLLLLTGFLIVFYHPLVTMMIVLILCIMQIMQYIQEIYEHRTLKKINYTYMIVFILTVFAFWSSYIIMAIDVAKPLISRIFGDPRVESELQKNVNLFSQVNSDPLYVLHLIFNIYGHWILLATVSLFSIGLMLKYLKDLDTESRYYKGVLALGFFMCLILSVAMFLTIDRFGFARVFAIAAIFSVLLIPSGVYLLFGNLHETSRSGRKNMILLGMILVIFCITYFSVFNLYYSPTIKLPNVQVPGTDYEGMRTFLLVPR